MHASYLQLGHFHIPIFGIFAALGIMAALTLSQHTAVYANILSERLWNAGTTAIISTLVISRLLLIAFNLKSFLEDPLLILALPSLTITGMVLTAFFMLGYISWRKLPLLPLLDAVAPCATLLWLFLSLGQIFDGTRDGMPTNLPWASRQSGTAPVHPVEIYSLVAASLLTFVTFQVLRVRHAEGHPTAIALISSGVVLFLIDLFRLPSELFDRAPLEGSQIIGVAMFLVGAALLMRSRSEAQQESGIESTHAV